MYSIAIETSTSVCSAALLHDAECLMFFVDRMGQNHARQLPLFVDDLLNEVRRQAISLDAVVLSQGPGSYTGLRIGTALAKGLCYGYGIPLIAVDTLQLMACSALKKLGAIEQDCLLNPMIDARRMEVYEGLYDSTLQRVGDVEARIIDAEYADDIVAQRGCKKIFVFGNGSDKCKGVIDADRVVFVDDIVPLASDTGRLAVEAYENKQFADVAYFDPFYLKEFQATIAKNKVIS